MGKVHMRAVKRTDDTSSRNEMSYALLRRQIADDPRDAAPKATLGLMQFSEEGPELSAVRLAFGQQPPPNEDDELRFRQVYLRTIEHQVQLAFCSIIAPLATPSPELAIRPYQELRNSVLSVCREKMAQQTLARAIALVTFRPEDALAIYAKGLPFTREIVAGFTTYLSAHARSEDHFYGQFSRRIQEFSGQLLAGPTPIDVLTEDDAVALASMQYGGMRLLVAGALGTQLLNASEVFINVLVHDTTENLSEYLKKNEFERYQDCLRELATLPLWGSYAPTLEVLAGRPFKEWPGLLAGFTMLHSIVDAAHNNALEREKLDRKLAAQAKKELTGLSHRLQDVEVELARTKEKLASQAVQVANLSLPSNASAVEARLLDQTKQTARFRQELEEKTSQLGDARNLLDALLGGAHPETTEASEPMTKHEFRRLRGVVIGGHQNFTSKLRKLLPDCLFYSVDQRRVDEPAVRERQFVLFFAGYCNHPLAEHALRISRLYGIPCGYTAHVNIPMCLQDIARLIGRSFDSPTC